MITDADLEAIRREVAKEYSLFPKRLVEDARSERTLVESEQGRYVLELLQNADDAQYPENATEGNKFGGPSVVFVVTKTHLYCANGGYPISKEGFDSICRAFVSPKRRSAPVIGFKGIGFKSVLSLTNRPEIFWHDDAAIFDRERTLEFLKETGVRAVAGFNADQVPVLRCPFNIDLKSEKAADQILQRLWKDHATVFRFQLADTAARSNLLSRLGEIKPSTVLFLNNLESIIVEVDGTSRVYRISKGVIKEGLTTAVIEEGESKTSWTMLSQDFPLELTLRKQLPPLWSETDAVRISFAIRTAPSGRYVPEQDYPVLHVFFPTEERLPVKMLIHGTFRTNTDRRLLVQDDPLNTFMIRKCAELLRDKVLPLLAGGLVEPGQIIDFISPPSNTDPNTTEGKIWTEMGTVLEDFDFVPRVSGTGNLAPSKVLLSPLPYDVVQFKKTLTGFADRFCVNSIDSSLQRRETLRQLRAEIFDVENLPGALEEHFSKDPTWVGNAYTTLDNTHSYLKTNDYVRSFQFITEVRKRRLLLLSDKTVVSSESVGQDGTIFFPPAGVTPIPPIGLKVRFLDRSALDEYLRISGKAIRQSVLNQELGVDEYAATPVMTKVVIPAVREFWTNWPRRTTFEPTKVLEFLSELLGEKLPRDDQLRAIALFPVPVKEEAHYAPAHEVYASKEWTGNDDLEFIYGSTANFLSPLADSIGAEDFERWKAMYQWLGVSWLPRILPQFEPTEADRWTGCIWLPYSKSFLNAPQLHLPGWDDYCKALAQDCAAMGPFNPLNKHESFLQTSWSLNKFEEIVSNPQRSRRLFSILARNWDNYYGQFAKCQVAWREKRQKFYISTDVPSYFFWTLKNEEWVAPSRPDLWGQIKPSRLFVASDSLSRRFGDLLPYAETASDEERSLLTKLGVRTHASELTREDWWRIMIDIPKFLPPDEREVRPLYRDMLQVERIEEPTPSRDRFLSLGKLLAVKGGVWSYVERNAVWYVEHEEFRRLFGEHIPIFAIQHEERKGAAIKRILGINMLEERLEPELEKGDPDEAASDLLNHFVDSAKPFLLARVSAQRPSREDEDVSLLRKLKVIAVKRLEVNYSLTMDEKEIFMPSGRSSYLDSDEGVIYIDARRFDLRNPEALARDQNICDELGVQIAYYLTIDLANDFAFLMASDEDHKLTILSRAEISQADVDHFREVLKGEAPRVQIPIQTTSMPGEEQVTVSAGVGQLTTPITRPQTESRQLELWDISELGFGEVTEVELESTPPPSMDHPDEGPIGGGIGHKAARVRTQEDRDVIAAAGVRIVMAYEERRHLNEHSCSPGVESKEKKKCGYDVLSQCKSESRQIEVKSSRGNVDVVEMTAPEWEAARKANEGNFYLYRVRYLDKHIGRTPELIIVKDPYSALYGEPTRFKVRLTRIKGKAQIVSLTTLSIPVVLPNQASETTMDSPESLLDS